MTTSEPTPESIAAMLEQTLEGRRVRALLLRELDDDDQIGSPVDAWEDALTAGLVCEPANGPSYALTPLGRMVAEASRPKPWTTRPDAGTQLIDPDGSVAGSFGSDGLATNIAALLTADDIAQAKRFEDASS